VVGWFIFSVADKADKSVNDLDSINSAVIVCHDSNIAVNKDKNRGSVAAKISLSSTKIVGLISTPSGSCSQ